MPSHSTRLRLAPDDPRPRSVTPCVVGFATSDDVRRKRLKPGTERSRSSNSAPGVCSRVALSMTEILAGVSAEICSVTVIDVLTGVSLSAGVWSAGVCASIAASQIAGTKHASIPPAPLRKPLRLGAEHNLIAGLIERRFNPP